MCTCQIDKNHKRGRTLTTAKQTKREEDNSTMDHTTTAWALRGVYTKEEGQCHTAEQTKGEGDDNSTMDHITTVWN